MNTNNPPTPESSPDSLSGRLSVIRWKIRQARFSRDDLIWKWGRYGCLLSAGIGFLFVMTVAALPSLRTLGLFSTPAAAPPGGASPSLDETLGRISVYAMPLGCLFGWIFGALGACVVLFIKPIFAAIFWDAARFEREYEGVPERLRRPHGPRGDETC
jgi:hypothetical protein